MHKTLCAFNCSYPADLSAMNVMEYWTSWKWRVDEWIHAFHSKWMKMNFTMPLAHNSSNALSSGLEPHAYKKLSP